MLADKLKRYFFGRDNCYPYDANNARSTCVCGKRRSKIVDRIWKVTDKENDAIYPKYYYQCPRCNTYSAINIYFPEDKYTDDYFEFLHISEEKRRLISERIDCLKQAVGSQLYKKGIIFDLGAGEGAFSHGLADEFSESTVYAVEADKRLEERFYNQNDRVKFVPMFVEDFLDQTEQKADLIVLTDVLEHVIWPENLLEKIAQSLAPGGIFYMTTPNSRTFDGEKPAPRPVPPDQIDWSHANRTCQHIFMIEPGLMVRMTKRRLKIIFESQEFETSLRRDSAYSTIIAQKAR